MCCLQETYFRYKDTHSLQVSGWRKIFHTKRNKKKAEVATLRLNRL